MQKSFYFTLHCAGMSVQDIGNCKLSGAAMNCAFSTTPSFTAEAVP